MVNHEVLSMEPILGAKVFDTLKSKAKGEEELTYREEKAKDFLKKILKVPLKQSKDLFKKIEELKISRLDPFFIVKIIEVMPKTGVEIRAVIGNSGIVLVEEDVKKILGVLKPYF